MMKRFVYLFCFFLFMATLSFAKAAIDLNQIIDRIELQGASDLTKPYIKDSFFMVQKGALALPSEVQSDIRRLFLTGFFRSVSANTYLDQDDFVLKYSVDENPLVSTLVFEGNHAFSDGQLRTVIRHRQGHVYNYDWLDLDILSLKNKYLESGYLLFQLSSVLFDPKTATLRYSLDEGVLRRVGIKGLTRLDGSLLTRQFLLRPGRSIYQYDLMHDRRFLQDTHYFSMVSMPDFVWVPEAQKYDIFFTVKEKKVNHFDVGIENEDVDEVVLFGQFFWHHFLIDTDKTTLKLQWATRDYDRFLSHLRTVKVSYYQPWFFNLFPLSFKLDIFKKVQQDVFSVQQLSQGEKTLINTERRGGKVQFGHPFFDQKLMVSSGFRHETILPRDDAVFDRYELVSLYQLFEYRSVMSVFNPKKGGYWTLNIERGGDFKWFDLGGLSFVSVKTDMAYFKSLSKRLVWGTHLALGGIHFDDYSGFESEGFILGGASTIRGYRDAAYRFVGQRKVLFNTEFRYNFSKKWQGVLFYDAGQTFDSGFDVSFSDFSVGYGVGVRYFIFLGPLRFDLAYGESVFLHFSISQLF